MQPRKEETKRSTSREMGATLTGIRKKHALPNYVLPMYSPPKPSKVKETIEVTGRGGKPVYAFADIRNAKYISSDVTFLDHEILYFKANDDGAAKYWFCLNFENLKADTFRCQCTVDDILNCEIRMNGIKLGLVKESSCQYAELLPQSDFLSITHEFTFAPDSTS